MSINVIKKATNRWTKGLVMDFSPENTRNEILTHALNATLLTFNGNEMSLQNDMGNARVETAYLPEGYIPVGTCEYGGIIYIVSYNPLEDKSQIGCFPSPERNISIDEMGLQSETKLSNSDFQLEDGNIKNSTKYVLLRNDKLNPGDKFIIYANEELYEEKLANLEKNNGVNWGMKEQNPILALNIVSIEDSGKITYLDSSIRKYEVTKSTNNGYFNEIFKLRYPILGKSNVEQPLTNEDIDEYRNVLSSGYSVFKSKTSGKLAILAELIAIDSYSVTHKVEEIEDENGQVIPDKYNIILYPEVSCEETENKYGITPKLSYYYLEESNLKLRLNFNSQDTNDYVESGTSYRPLFIETSQGWNQNINFINTNLSDIFNTTELDSSHKSLTLTQLYSQYYTGDEYKNPFQFYQPETYHETVFDTNTDEYNAVNLGSIVLPENTNGVNQTQSYKLPLVYKYTIVPCMSYGKLQNLAVSNTIDFTNINNFSASKFNVWKYRVDGPTVHLQFGAEVYDTNANPVTALVLEFYDLWGFAGSLIIDNKKAYSGTFTKILTLNTAGQLETKKVPHIQSIKGNITGEYSTNYQRNIKIIQNYDSDKYFLNESEIKFDNDIGWRNSDKSDIENDCGTLYQNLIYGVKAYFVQDDPNDSNKKTFTFKDQFFMFTNPLFNEYYYIQNNFNNLNNPELDFVFTSRIKDNSTKESLSYTNGSLTIENGYKSGSKIEEYTKGSSTETNIHDTKYYKYKGTSELQLEIGLKKDYENIGLSYDRNINKYFSCNLKLINNDDNGSWSVESDSEITDRNILLNYSENQLKDDPNLNSLCFSNNTNTLKIDYNNLQKYHFLDPNDQSGSFIPIEYEFVVGYSVTIDNIRDAQIPATTVCALCHKRDDGTYNYEDFGIEERIDSDNNPIYFSKTIFYNSGTKSDVNFGICRHLTTSGTALEQCQKVVSYDYDSSDIRTPNILNTGTPLKELLPYIGKLTFCEPHLSGYSYDNGVSVSPHQGSIYINPDLGKYVTAGETNENVHNQTYGIAPSNSLYNKPYYLLCVNTVNMIDRQSEFAVNMNYKLDSDVNSIIIGYGDHRRPILCAKSVTAAKIIGLLGNELVDFNKKLIQTMKSIYAYNPDYTSLTVRKGDISILDNKIRFTSNIISENADINFNEGKTLNDFIAIGNMSFSSYFINLNTYSNKSILVKDGSGKWISQIDFKGNVDYCGGNNNKALISNLVYNTPDISELYDELTFNNNVITIMHEDGSKSSIQGDLNTKALYGYMKDENSLIQLDVSNYKIDYNGNLTLKNINTIKQIYHFPVNNINIEEALSDSGHNKEISLPNGKTITINIKFEVTDGNNNGILKKSNIGDPEHLFLLIDTQTDSGGTTPIANLNMNITIIDKEDYVIQFSKKSFKIKLDMGTVFLTKDYNSNILQEYSDEVLLDHLTNQSYLTNLGLSGIPRIGDSYMLEKEDNSSYPLKIILKDKNQQEVNYAQIQNSSNGITYLMSLYINDIYFTITTNEIISVKNDISSIIPTQDYYKYDQGKYIIDSQLYPDTFIRGTNITINDLVYMPNVDGHRLYMRPNCFKYQSNSVLHYRTLATDEGDVINTTWKGDTYYYNTLFINSGPCFIPDNLN